MVVWAEIPYISRHMSEGNENTLSQLRELIVQNRNHPSVCFWGLSNEITMNGTDDPELIDNHRRLNELAHRLDKTRPTAIACLSMCDPDEKYVSIPDAVAYNHYFGWYGGDMNDYGAWFDKFREKHPNTPIGCSEYGCEALNLHSPTPESGDYTEEYQALYHEALIRQLFPRKYLFATYVWNMFDFGADARAEGGENGLNHKGLVTFDRKYKKDAFFAYKAHLSDEPFVHICGKRYVDRTEEITSVTVYSNLPEVELFANGVSLEKKTSKDHFFRFEVPNSGETRLTAEAGGCRDESLIRKTDRPNPDYILHEQYAVLNWFDITEQKGHFSLNDRIGDITKTLRGKLLLYGLCRTISKKMKNSGGHTSAGKKASTPKIGADAVRMLENFTVLRLTGMLAMQNVSFTREELLSLNRKLNKLRKPSR